MQPDMNLLPDAMNGATGCGCPLCETSTNSDAAYFARAFGKPHFVESTAEALADSLGFCHRHGAALLDHYSLPESHANTRDIVCKAIPHILPLTNEGWLHEPQVQQVLFGADSTCPACTAANRAVGRQASAAARQLARSDEATETDSNGFCIAHFQAFAGFMSPERRLTLLTIRIAFMEQTLHRVRTLLRKIREGEECLTVEEDNVLQETLRLAIGQSPQVSNKVHPSNALMADALMQTKTLADAIALPDICPICVENERARRRWLDRLQAAASFDDETWLFLPTCPEHLAEIARLDQPVLVLAALARTFSVALRYQRQQIHSLTQTAALEEEIARIKADGPEAWTAHKRKRARQRADLPKLPPPPRMSKCSACERSEIAAEYAVGTLLDLLENGKHRDTFIQGYGLCLKHFARTYRISPKGTIRTLLADDVRHRLEDAASHLGSKCLNTLHRFCGFV